MDFDLSKENIQPLRGGRNVAQLGIALQAQSSQEVQRELLLQKESFENAIRNYEGDDPLDIWYQYVSWVEQSYPKHGHEGNLMLLLEDCLSKFEHDKKYLQDRRLCKLFVKYIDMQQNPLELYQMLYSKGLYKGVSDLYRAWAYYHEVAGDYRNADAVFQLGRKELAQPYEELLEAHKNMIYAAGQQLISGIDQHRLANQRHALTSLHTYKPGKVGSIRIPSKSGAGVLPAASSLPKPNTMVDVFEDNTDLALQGAAAPPVSVLTVARSKEAPKENILKPGVWTSGSKQRKSHSSVHSYTPFKVHEDDGGELNGLKLPKNFIPVTHENYSDWHSIICPAEPEDNTKIPMYPKTLVYNGGITEYSIEEIRSLRYRKNHNSSRLNVPVVETEQAIQSILVRPEHESSHDKLNVEEALQMQGIQQHQEKVLESTHQSNLHIQSLQQHEYFAPAVNEHSYFHQASNESHQFHMQPPQRAFQEQLPQRAFQEQPLHDSFQAQHIDGNSNVQQHSIQHQHHEQILQQNCFSKPEHSFQQQDQHMFPQNHSILQNALLQPSPFDRGDNSGLKMSFHELTQAEAPAESSAVHKAYIDIWQNTFEEIAEVPQQKQREPIVIYEEPQLNVSAMKTPIKDLSTDDLAETASRGGLDIAAAAQPCDGAKRIAIFEDDSSSYESRRSIAFDPALNTQAFNFNLNAMHVSTPQNNNVTSNVSNIDALKSSKKQLFEKEPEKILSVIYEETKSYGSGSSVGSIKSSTVLQSRKVMPKISEEENRYHFNLAQNLKANEELRASLLGELMECETQPSSPVAEKHFPLITPLDVVPSDPFNPALIKVLLQKVNFPVNHKLGYNVVHTIPRLVGKKEIVTLGNDKHMVEKILGKGAYGSVFKAINSRTKQAVALKHQKPPNKWEFYICQEIQFRLATHPLRERFMDIHIGYYSDQASLLLSEFSPNGSLLDFANTYKQKAGRTMKESMCIYFCLEMLKIVETLHEIKIIHADIKPDNFLVFLKNNQIILQLIDFGCSIDMSLLPENSTFTRQITTENFICCEMRDRRPWSYHTDLFCVAATAHVLLFDKYISLQKIDEHWSLTQKFMRYYKFSLWNEFFSCLLNQQQGVADNKRLQVILNENLEQSQDLNGDIRYMMNILKNR